MNTSDLVLSVLVNEPEGAVLGRTLLQKKLFFLNEMISGPVRFYPHYYGPYSREVSEAVDSLVSAGILRERVEVFPSFQTPWGESTRYSYDFPENVRDRVSSIVKNRIGKEIFSRLCEELKQINDRPEANDYKSLSIAAKVLQILKEKEEMHVSDFPTEAKRLRWRLTTKDVNKAAEFLKGIGLLTEAR